MSDAQWIVDDFSAALAQLHSALSEPATIDLIKAGCIQYFEFCFELGWKAWGGVRRPGLAGLSVTQGLFAAGVYPRLD